MGVSTVAAPRDRLVLVAVVVVIVGVVRIVIA
jgi:hypothetical protein